MVEARLVLTQLRFGVFQIFPSFVEIRPPSETFQSKLALQKANSF